MTHTPDELRAAIGACANVTAEVAASYDQTDTEGDRLERAAAILRAHLETLAFLEAAEAYCGRVNLMGHPEQDKTAADAWDRMRAAYRALVAKREKP